MTRKTNTIHRRISMQTLLAFLLVIFGMAVVMIALYMPPVGEIHPSVITVFGMLLVAAGAFIGIDLNFKIKSFIDDLHEKDKTSDTENHADTQER